MIYFLKSRYTLRFTTITILLFLLIPSYSSFADSNQWDNNWSYSQEIKIPFDTSLEIAHFQPIDIQVEFQNPCWAKNNLEHSIRVCCWDGRHWHELESQIDRLEKRNGNFITSCNIVFLIPDFADGNEKYFVYYDDSEKPAPNYFDHVTIEESYYNYEPIPGYPLESSYYKIIDDNYIAYAVSYEGQLMGYNTCQHVTKMKEGTVEMLPKNGELFAAFDFKYTYEKSLFGYSSTSQKLVSKEVLVDGNLMLEFGIVSHSKFDDLQTTATYKYYHCPTQNTRVHVHVKHESLKEISVYPNPPATNTDGVFASLQCGGIKCKSIKELNIGRILPFMHFFNEIETTSEYRIDIDPQYISDGDPDIRVISVQDDVDLGKKAWVSFDEGKTGVSHSIIFSSNTIMVSGTNEKDGIQLNVFEMDYPHLPGLENNIATIQAGRNSVETGKQHDLIIPDDFIVEFDAEFFSSKTDGFRIVEEEVEIFQELVKIKPPSNGEVNEIPDEVEKHDLSVIVHYAPSIPMGSSLSAFLGLNLSFISVELFEDDEFIYSENAVRIPMNAIQELDDPSFLEKIFATLKIFDLKNISFFKKAVFPEIDQGSYVIKIFRENPLLSNEKQYIGYAIVDLQQDEKIHVLCRSEASIEVTIIDQNTIAVKNAELLLQKDDSTIAKILTNEKGQATIKAPTSVESYDFKVLYNGVVIYQEPIRLGFLEKVFSFEKTIIIQRYTLDLNVVDTWGQTPGVELNPVLTVKQTDESIRIQGENFEDGKYVFTNLTPNTYQLRLTFKSFTVNHDIEISEDKKLELDFPAEYNVKLNVMDARGMPYEHSKIIINRNNKKLELQNKESETIVTIPPGEYQVEIFDNTELIGRRTIDVYGEQKYDLVTNHQPMYPTIIFIVGCFILLISLIFFCHRRALKYFYIILILMLLTFSLFLPWWEINGSTDQLQTSTSLYFIPNNMITITSTENTIAGEPSYLPFEFQNAINLIVILTIAGCILLVLNQFFKNTGKRLYQLAKIFAILSLIGAVLVFIIAMNELCSVSIGSIIGNGYLDVGVPGESQIHLVLSNWGLGIGFYLYLTSIIMLFMTISIEIKKWRRKNNGK